MEKSYLGRNSNLELYRIVMMLLIVASHFATPICKYFSTAGLHGIQLYQIVFSSGGKIGINSFVLLSSYFMCSQDIKISKFIKLIAQVYFYSIVVSLSSIALLNPEVSIKNMFQNIIFPFAYNDIDHFATPFIFFYLLTPFLRKIVENIDKKTHGILIIVCLTCYVLYSFPFLSVRLDAVAWFCVLFFIASYIKFYFKLSDDSKIGVIFWTTFVAVIIILCLLLTFNLPALRLIGNANSIFALIVSVISFLYFLNLKLGNNKLINTIASTTFGVFLIHTNYFLRHWLWYDFVDSEKWFFADGLSGIIAPLSYVLLIFVVCSLLDFVRKAIIEKYYLRVIFRIFRISNNE